MKNLENSTQNLFSDTDSESAEVVLNPEYLAHADNAFHSLAENLASDNSFASSDSTTTVSEPII